MRQISDLTYLVVAYSEIPAFKSDDCIDWALEMVDLGYDTPTLFILAGLDKPVNYFEVINYLKDALKELKLELKTGNDAIESYVRYLLLRISIGEHTKENLTELYNFCNARDYEKPVYDFYLLYWAWGDLDYGNERQDYYEGANKNNIEGIIKTTALEWLKANDAHPDTLAT